MTDLIASLQIISMLNVESDSFPVLYVKKKQILSITIRFWPVLSPNLFLEIFKINEVTAGGCLLQGNK